MQIKLIFTTKVSHLASFWKWDFLELGNGLLACDQALQGALAAGQEKEGKLPTTSLKFEYPHQKSWGEMLIGGDDISNDTITLGMCFSMLVYIRAPFPFA